MIREVRDAGRVRDESLMNRVKALIEEKSWTHNETNMRTLRELEEVKVSVRIYVISSRHKFCTLSLSLSDFRFIYTISN